MPNRQIASFRLAGVVAAFSLLPLFGCGQEGQNGLEGSVGAGTGMAEMTWEPPTTNSDGTPLTQLAGYRIYYGTTSPLDKSTSLSIDVGTDTSFTLSGLDAGTYFFAATAYDAMGNESALSEEASKTITAS